MPSPPQRLRAGVLQPQKRSRSATGPIDRASSYAATPNGTVNLTGIHSFSTRNQFYPAPQISNLAGISISGTSKKSVNVTVPLAETALKEIKKNGIFILPGIGRLVKSKRKARMGKEPSHRCGHQDSSQDGGEVPGCQGLHRSEQGEEEVISWF